ncbi:MAG TPA: carbohydrate porin [Phycisphaerales bacterium]|nr:carbohydrate porin [Phycisphaerales bacterium]
MAELVRRPLISVAVLASVAGVACARQAGGESTPAASAAAPAAESALGNPDDAGSWSERRRLTGDWGGARTNLENKGLKFDLGWTQTVQGVVDGGRRRDWDYGTSFEMVLATDMQKLVGVPGGFGKIRVEGRTGESVNDDSGVILPTSTDGFFPLTTPGNESILTVTELNYAQFLSEQFGLVFGKLQTLDGDPNEFASGRGRSQFMNFNFIANGVASRTIPYSAIGGGVVWLPAKSLMISSLIMTTVDSSTTSGFEHLDDGWTWTTELNYQYKAGNLPGGFNVGAIYAFNGDFANLTDKLSLVRGEGIETPTDESTWAVYTSFWQYVYSPDAAPEKIDLQNGTMDMRGVGVFGRLGIADHETNPIEWSVSGGVAARGMFFGRENDTLGFGYSYSGISDTRRFVDLALEDGTQALELFYNVAITPAMGLTFDIQWLDGALTPIDEATVVGARFDVRF